MCSVSGSTVTFETKRARVSIDANQTPATPGTQAAPQPQTVAVTGRTFRPAAVRPAAVHPPAVRLAVTSISRTPQGQTITFTSVPPANPVPGYTYVVAATGGRSGDPVTYTIDPSSTSICSVSGSTVTFNQPGSCVIDADQAGNARYKAAPQIQQTVAVISPIAQTITFTSTPNGAYFPGDTYVVTATGGRSDNPVTAQHRSVEHLAARVSGSTVTIGTDVPNRGVYVSLTPSQAGGGMNPRQPHKPGRH